MKLKTAILLLLLGVCWSTPMLCQMHAHQTDNAKMKGSEWLEADSIVPQVSRAYMVLKVRPFATLMTPLLSNFKGLGGEVEVGVLKRLSLAYEYLSFRNVRRNTTNQGSRNNFSVKWYLPGFEVWKPSTSMGGLYLEYYHSYLSRNEYQPYKRGPIEQELTSHVNGLGVGYQRITKKRVAIGANLGLGVSNIRRSDVAAYRGLDVRGGLSFGFQPL